MTTFFEYYLGVVRHSPNRFRMGGFLTWMMGFYSSNEVEVQD